MMTKTDLIAPGIYRLSTCVPDLGPGGFTFNQFVIEADQPLLYHTGPRAMYPLVSHAVDRLVGLANLRWVAFSHVESDECGAMNEFLAAAPHAQVPHGQPGVMVSLNDLCDRPPVALENGQVLDLGGKRVRHIDTPHVPHNWESRVLFEETTRTLFCGDLFTHFGDGPALTSEDLVPAAMMAEDAFHSTGASPAVGATLRMLAQLEPKVLAIMHGSSFEGDCAALLRRLADAYDARIEAPRPQAAL
ncbi:MAG: MBL fold metallo-hydrolase [Deltaproteobacteria bacterium]|nr:MAG: MBL fold metallo-hydrolase [Deltaproteobacteria bacterium]